MTLLSPQHLAHVTPGLTREGQTRSPSSQHLLSTQTGSSFFSLFLIPPVAGLGQGQSQEE